MEKWDEVISTFWELEAKNPVMLLASGRVLGAVEEARRLLDVQGTRRFGKIAEKTDDL